MAAFPLKKKSFVASSYPFSCCVVYSSLPIDKYCQGISYDTSTKDDVAFELDTAVGRQTNVISYLIPGTKHNMPDIREFREKEMKTKQKMFRGWCSWRVLPGFGNL